MFSFGVSQGLIDINAPIVLDSLFKDFESKDIEKVMKLISPRRRAEVVEPASSLLLDHSRLGPANIQIGFNDITNIISNYLKNPLNQSQQSVFQHSFENKVTLLWGLPGTGKTTTSAAIVLGWIENTIVNNSPINIGLGSSNWNAIDNLLKEIVLLLNRRLASIGGFDFNISIDRVRSESGNEFSYGNINDIVVYTAEAENVKNQLNAGSQINIIGSTWKQLYNLSKPARGESATSEKWFDLLIIDESSQVKVEHASGYFLFLKENAHLLLAGDDKQLGPIHGFQMEDHDQGLFDCIYTFMKETHKVEPCPIVENYRSNSWINSWPNTRFYEHLLDSRNPERNLELQLPTSQPEFWPSSLPWNDEYLNILDSSSPIVVITYSASTDTVSNIFEAQILSALCCLYRLVLGEGVSEKAFVEENIGIVTPHRAQRSQIQNLLLEAEINIHDGTFVDTVDRFQGQERDLILASYCVSDKEFVSAEDEFILDPRRFNVSLTRAKSKFVMIVSEALIDYLPNDKIIAEEASHLQMFVEKYCDCERIINLQYFNHGEPQVVCKLKTPL